MGTAIPNNNLKGKFGIIDKSTPELMAYSAVFTEIV